MKKKKITLESHLHELAETDENLKNLESVFQIQKQKVKRYLSSVGTSFPTYSAHDATHSMNIVSAIEKILGQKMIKRLSGVDSFLLLMCAYMHDTGMLYSDEEVNELWETEEFKGFLADSREREDEVGKAARKIAKAEAGEVDSILEIRQAVTVVLMEYFRPRHGQRIQTVTDARASAFGTLLSIDDSCLPDRMIHNIYQISMAHNWAFEDVLNKMVFEDSFGTEEFHPRMIAYLIRIGDLCDMDNNRFNGVGIKVFGNLGEENLAHYFKHKSVETLHLSSEVIDIEANVSHERIQRECEDNWLKKMEKTERDSAVERIFQNTVKEHINWKSWMEQEVTSGKLHAAELFPDRKRISVPELRYRILIDGEESESTHKNLKFLFSTEKAFQLIEGISMYQNNKLIFVRELIQNALDATKLQIYRTLCASGFAFSEHTSPFDVEREFPDLFQNHEIVISTDYDSDTGRVSFSIRDKGIGISMEEFKRNILTTGRSWPERKEYQNEIRQMPAWLRPTGAFGIGLHTVFSVTDSLTIRTKSDSEGKANEMTLHSGKKGGYAFCRKIDRPLPRGSEFRFSFFMTDDRKEYFEGILQGKRFLEKWKDEVRQAIVETMNRFCVTPMVPIRMEEEWGTPALVQSTWYNELGRSEKINTLLYERIASERYRFAFSDDYQSFELWDRENDCALNFGFSSAEERYNVCYKGIRLAERIESGKGSECLYLEQMDILSGAGNEWIDAARMKLTAEARRKLEKMVEDASTFARKMYVAMLDEFYRDEEIKNLTADLDALAKRVFQEKEIAFQELWEESRRLKEKYWGNGDESNYKTLTKKTLTYFLITEVLDRSLKLWKQPVTIEEARHIFLLIDQMMKRWKMDWKGMDEQFYRTFFNDQMRELLKHFLQMAGIRLFGIWKERLSFKENGKTSFYQYKNLIERISLAFYREYFPFCSVWRYTRELYEYIGETALQGLGGLRPEFQYRVSNLAMWRYCMLNSGLDKIFQKWKMENTFSEVKTLELFLKFPFRPEIVLDIPGRSCEMDKTEKRVWRTFFSNSYVGWEPFVEMEPFVGEVRELPETEKIVVERPLTENRRELFPFWHRMFLVRMDGKEMEFRVHHKKEQGIRVAPQMKQRIFREFWRTIEMISETDFKSYVDIMAMEEYPLLGIWDPEEQYLGQAGLEICYARIPLWGYGVEIRNFLWPYAGCAMGEEMEGIVAHIVDSEKGKSVISYIVEKREKEGNKVKAEEVAEQYKEFLRELIRCWGEEHGCTFGVG